MNDHRKTENIEADIAHTREQMSETLDAIQDRLSPGRLIDEAIGYFKNGSGSNGFAKNLTDTVTHNPVPVALVGIGLGWLMMSSNKSHEPSGQRSRIYTGPYDYDPGYRDPSYRTVDRNAVTEPIYRPDDHRSRSHGTTADSKLDSLKDKAGNAAATASSTVGDMRDKASAAVNDAAAKTSSAVADMSDKASAAVSSVAASAGRAIDDVRDGARAGVRYVSEHSRHFADDVNYQVRHQAERAQAGFDYMLREQPLTLIGLGLAVGAAIGAALPPTRREDEWMGQTRDDLTDRAIETGSEQLEKAKKIGEAAMHAAEEEANKEGTSIADSGRKLANDAIQSAKRVAEKAKDAAASAAEKEGVTKSAAGSKNTVAGNTTTPAGTSSNTVR